MITSFLLNGFDRRARLVVAVLLALAVLVPASSLLTADDSFVHVSTYQLTLMGKYLTYGFVAIGLVMLWGWGGTLSLGQGVFFGLGGYCMAMFLKLEASSVENTKIQSTPIAITAVSEKTIENASRPSSTLPWPTSME